MPETKESPSPAEIERERWEEQTLKPALEQTSRTKKEFSDGLAGRSRASLYTR